MQFIDPTADPTEQRLTHLRNGLLQLHKSLLDSERAAYERDVERISSPGHMLNLLLHDPWFAWLHELSQFIVVIDELLDSKEQSATPDDAGRLIAQSRKLISPEETGSGFPRRYFEAMQRDPDVVLAHSRMLKVIASLG